MTVFVRLTGEAIALQALDSDAVRRLLAGLSRTQWAPSLSLSEEWTPAHRRAPWPETPRRSPLDGRYGSRAAA
jgi:hypothetical protein